MADPLSRLTATLADRYRLECEPGAGIGAERFVVEMQTTTARLGP